MVSAPIVTSGADVGRCRIDQGDTGCHQGTVDPRLEQPSHLGQLGAAVDAANLVRVVEPFGKDDPAALR